MMTESSGVAVYAQLSSSVDQIMKSIEPETVTFNTEDGLVGIEHNPTHRAGDVVIQEDGLYFVLAAGQVGRRSGILLQYIDLWFRLNGEDVPNTNVRASMPASLYVNDTKVLVSQNAMSLKRGDVLNVMISVSEEEDKLGLLASEPDGEPRIPSIIFTMYRFG